MLKKCILLYKNTDLIQENDQLHGDDGHCLYLMLRRISTARRQETTEVGTPVVVRLFEKPIKIP